MTANNQDELMRCLDTELATMDPHSAERLCKILRGLFSCMQDLNERLTVLENPATRPSPEQN
ncbi:hypothetical protein [Luteolibacter marinus]|uniref:hypothetical protein n=1 Tax=Luteolibacter marinus TaxID=2776705 RepID=UPI0018693704|nr:hypothetical protein [Luteolibacter marinus]